MWSKIIFLDIFSSKKLIFPNNDKSCTVYMGGRLTHFSHFRWKLLKCYWLRRLVYLGKMDCIIISIHCKWLQMLMTLLPKWNNISFYWIKRNPFWIHYNNSNVSCNLLNNLYSCQSQLCKSYFDSQMRFEIVGCALDK